MWWIIIIDCVACGTVLAITVGYCRYTRRRALARAAATSPATDSVGQRGFLSMDFAEGVYGVLAILAMIAIVGVTRYLLLGRI